MVATASTAPFSVSIASRTRIFSSSFVNPRSLKRSVVCAFPNSGDDSSKTGFSRGNSDLCLRLDGKNLLDASDSYRTIKAQTANPPIMPAMMTPGGAMDLASVLLRNRIIFIGQPINAQVAQKVISQLVTLAAIDENSDILLYLNCPGGNIYSVLSIYDCMSWIKPKVGTVCFAVTASEATVILAGGDKGMRFAMPNARILLHQPQGVTGGQYYNVKTQTNEIAHSRHKIDKMLTAFTGQPQEVVQQYTDLDHFLSPAEAMEFGVIDGILETKY